MSPLLKMENVVYKINKRTVLNIKEFSVEENDIMGIMGPNGAGKSTLLKLLSLLDFPNEGRIEYRQKRIEAGNITINLRRKFAIAMQQASLLNTSVYQNVAIGLKVRKVPKKLIKEKVDYWLDVFKISHLAKKHAYHLSGGEAQRVNLARALILDPEVLFLDEPFAALDFPTKIQLLKELKEILKKTNTTTVFVSHDLLEVKFLTDKLAILMEGEIRQTGETKAVIESPNEKTAPFIREWNDFIK